MDRRMTAVFIPLVMVLLFSISIHAQSVAINDNGSAPSPSAMLDVNVFGVNKKGVLVPRMTSAQRIAIPAPATGLLVFDTNTSGFWYYTGSQWLEMISAGNNLWSKTGNDIYNSNTGNIGIGTNTPKSYFNVAQNKTVIFGSDSLSSVVGNKFIWFPSKGAIRFGKLDFTGTGWDYANIGVNSIAIGDLTRASGPQSFVQGYGSTASGFYSFARGFAATASGDHSMAFGQNMVATGSRAMALGEGARQDGDFSFSNGYNNIVTGDFASAFGLGLSARTYNSFVVGRYNDSITASSSSSWVVNDPLFVVGNGTADNARSNAMTIVKNGNVGIHNNNPLELLHVGTGTGDAIRLGSVERFEDFGSNLIGISAAFVPLTDIAYSLGNATNRWTTVYAQNGTINTSDLRDKQNIKPIAYGLESLMKLNPVSYEWKNGSIGSGAKLGLIAQEVMKVIPEVVKTHETVITDEASKQTMEKEMDRYGIYYSDLIPLLIKSIQEQQQKITTLEARLKALEDKLK